VSIRAFLRAVDASWKWPRETTIPLRIIGAGALLLQTEYDRGTKDSDVLESDSIEPETQARLLRLANRESAIYRRQKMFIEFVPRGLPFLPQAPVWREPVDLNEGLRHFHVEALDVVDVVVSKLARFLPEDGSDIGAMVDKGLVPHAAFLARFRSAMDAHSSDERLLVFAQRFNRIERDAFGVAETHFDFDEWLTDRFD
jgi:hypothetical protein